MRFARGLAAVVVLTFATLAPLGRPAAALTQNEKYVHAVFEDFLLREPTIDEVTWWAAYLSGNSRSAFMTLQFDDDEFLQLWLSGVRYYYVGTVSIDSQFASDLAALQTSGDFVESEVSVLAGALYFTRSGSTNNGFVSALYDSVLYRAADPGGLSYWVGRLNAATATRSSVARHFIRTAEAANKRVGGTSGPTSCTSTSLVGATDLRAGSYCIFLDRMATSGEISYWGPILGGTDQLPTFWTQLAVSTEYFNNAQLRF